MTILAFIPARGGSKGILKKNLALLNGNPLIKYTVDAAKNSKSIDEVFLSSDDPDIIEYCSTLGIHSAYKRPDALAADDSSMVDVVLDGLEWLKKHTGSLPTEIMLLQPTSPLRTSKHIDEAIKVFNETGADSLVSVHEMIEHPYECIKLENNKWVYLAKSPIDIYRRQDYKELFYFINGAIYLVKTDYLLNERRFISEGKTVLYYMEPRFGIDVDDIHDLKNAAFNLTNVSGDEKG